MTRRCEPRSCSNGNPLWKGPERLAGSSFARARAFKHEALYTFLALCTCRKVDGTDRFKPWRDFSRVREACRARSGIRRRCMHPMCRKYWCRGASPRFSWFEGFLVRGILSSITLNRWSSANLFLPLPPRTSNARMLQVIVVWSKSCGYIRTTKLVAKDRKAEMLCMWMQRECKKYFKTAQIHRLRSYILSSSA